MPLRGSVNPCWPLAPLQQLAQRDVPLAAGRELGPVRADPLVQAQHPVLHQQRDDQMAEPLLAEYTPSGESPVGSGPVHRSTISSRSRDARNPTGKGDVVN